MRRHNKLAIIVGIDVYIWFFKRVYVASNERHEYIEALS